MTVTDVITGALPHRRAEAERFAALLDGRRVNGGAVDHPELVALAGLARALSPVEHAPDAGFRTALRERLVAEAATREVTSPEARRSGAVAVPASPGTDGERRPPRWRSAVATLAVAALVSGVGAAAASNRALPGDSLYGLKRSIESVELALARSELDRGRELLDQADARLTEAERLASSSEVGEPETQQQLRETLVEMATVTTEGADALMSSYRDTGDREPLLVLDRFVVAQQDRLKDLMSLLGPDMRAQLSTLLDELARLDSRALALLGLPASALTAVEAAQASGDGWAVSRRLSLPALSDGSAPGGTDLAGSAGDVTAAGPVAGDGSGSGGIVGDLLDDTTGALTGGSGRSGGSGSGTAGATGAGGVVDGVTDGATTVLDPVTSPLPLPTSAPLPTVTPLPTLDPTNLTSPLPTVSACVTLLGVETC